MGEHEKFSCKKSCERRHSNFRCAKYSKGNKSIEDLLFSNKGSFDSKIAKHANIAAAPLSAWVKASVQYSYILEQIQPLEIEQAGIESNFKKTENRKRKPEKLLNFVNQKVSGLKQKFQRKTSEPATLETELSKA